MLIALRLFDFARFSELFDMFQRTKAPGQATLSGLGSGPSEAQFQSVGLGVPGKSAAKLRARPGVGLDRGMTGLVEQGAFFSR